MKLVDPGTARASALRQADVSLGTVVENRLLSHGGPEKRHIEFDLPENTLYQAGDYLAMSVLPLLSLEERVLTATSSLPTNPEPSVRRVLARFNISSEQEVGSPHLLLVFITHTKTSS
jgi:cytochrome P450/NADPH-cytochrome P450 reductase